MITNKIATTLFLFFAIMLCGTAQTTTVKGVVKDQQTGEALGFADIYFTDSYIGTTAEYDGSFELSTDNLSLTSISVTFLGYETKVVAITPGQSQSLTISIGEESAELVEVEVRAKRKIKKDTAAIALYRRVVKNKHKHRPSHYDYYYYEDYTKTRFDLFNVKEKLTNRKILKPFNFVFENMDTTEAGVTFLPMLIKEKVSDVYFRKKPSKNKTIVKADQFSGVERKEFFGKAEASFPEIDIYTNTMDLSGKIFTSPFARTALISYKYFLADSMQMGDHFCYKLEFVPKRKGDLAFTGHAWIDKQSAAVKSLKVYLLDQANINFLTGLEVKQNYADLGEGRWFKEWEQMTVMMNPTENKKHQAVRVVKTISYRDIEINQPYGEEIFKGDGVEIADKAYKRTQEHWANIRHRELSKKEATIYTNVKKVKETKAYKVYSYLGKTVSSGFFNAGPVEFGRFFQTFSWNAIEGNRYRFGMRTNPHQFRDKFLIEGYMAYGDKDKLFKYHLGSKVHLNRKNNKWHMVGGHYRYDWSDFNFHNPYMSHDHILGSLMRKQPLDNLFLIREGYGFYEKEWIQGLTNKFSAKHKRIYEWPSSFQLNTETPDSLITGQGSFEAAELSIHTRWGMGQVFRSRSGGFGRESVDITAPVINFNYTAGIKGVLGSDYNYHQISGSISQRFKSQAGRTYYTVAGGKIWGKVPYPLLTVHKGNKNFLFNRHAYSMMDDLEFVNDAYIKVDARHHFDGFLFNMIPGVSKMKMRSVVFAKGIYGSLSEDNQTLLGPDAQIKDLNGFYAEVGLGVENIFKIFRVYGFMRLTQLDDPDVTRFGVKFDFSPSF